MREVIFFLALFAVSCALPAKKYDNDKYMHHHIVHKRSTSQQFYVAEAEQTVDYWRSSAQATLMHQLNKTEITSKAKNIILFLGDGMSIPTLAAARAYQGQIQGKSGEESRLSFEEFPYTALSKTYCVDRQVPDSACTATSYLCGVKSNYGTVGVSPVVPRDSCALMSNTSNHVSSIGRWAQLGLKSTGVVTTTRITHASPSGVYAHTAERDWESDKDVKEAGEECEDIARMMVEGKTGRRLNVVLGGGRRKFLPHDYIDEEGFTGERLDNRNLISEWETSKASSGHKAEYVWNRDQLLNVQPDTDYLLGLFDGDHCPYHLDADPDTEPTLAEMTEAAVKMLEKNENGYFLFVEGGRIDHAHHDSKAQKALDETIQFSEAVRLARKITNLEDTLIVVTSDHAHTMSMAGYPKRGNDIFGIAGMSSKDKRPYSTLSYANGPGYQNVDENGDRHDLSEDHMDDKNYQFPSIAPLSSETHGGDDVGIFASGPWAHLFTGVLEQNVIPHFMAYAACIGHGATMCDS